MCPVIRKSGVADGGGIGVESRSGGGKVVVAGVDSGGITPQNIDLLSCH